MAAIAAAGCPASATGSGGAVTARVAGEAPPARAASTAGTAVAAFAAVRQRGWRCAATSAAISVALPIAAMVRVLHENSPFPYAAAQAARRRAPAPASASRERTSAGRQPPPARALSGRPRYRSPQPSGDSPR